MKNLYNLIDLFYKTAKTITEHENIESELDNYRDPAAFDRLDDDAIHYFDQIEEILPLLKTLQVKEKMKDERVETIRIIFNSSVELVDNYLNDVVTNPNLYVNKKEELRYILSTTIPCIKLIKDIMPSIKDFSGALSGRINYIIENYLMKYQSRFADDWLYIKIYNLIYDIKSQTNKVEEINNTFIENKNINYSYLKDVALFLFQRLVYLHAVDDSSGQDLINKFVGDIIRKKRFDLLKFLDKRYHFGFHCGDNSRLVRYYCHLFGKANTINDMYKLLDIVREASKYFTNGGETESSISMPQFKSDEIISFVKSKGKDRFIKIMYKLHENFMKFQNIAHNVADENIYIITPSQIIKGINSDAEKKLIETYYTIIEFKEKIDDEDENNYSSISIEDYLIKYLKLPKFNLSDNEIIEIKDTINFITDLATNKKYTYKDIIKHISKINWINSKIAYINAKAAGSISQKTLAQIGYGYLDEQNPNQTKYKKLYDINGFEPFSGFRFHVVEPNSDRYLTIGVETDCCQRIGGAGEQAAIDSYKNPLAGLLLLEKKGNDGKWDLVSQSYFHYVPEQNGFILDNVEDNEYIAKNLPANFIETCYYKLANYAKELGFKYLLAGKGWSKINTEAFETTKLDDDPRFFAVDDHYSDFKYDDAMDLSKMKRNIEVTRKPKSVKTNINPKDRALFERPLTQRMNFREFMRERNKKLN